jgi:SH3 domain-containing kinase-binding protein 1
MKIDLLAVKEQCVVLFPYAAVNDDELSLAEGQIINVVSKDVEDKGWWKGEYEGKVGVFPDNFVKMLTAAPSAAGSAEEVLIRRQKSVEIF